MASLRRDHHGRTYMVRVCPYHGHANVGCCDRETIIIETVPIQRMHELQAARDAAVKERDALRAARRVVCNVGAAVLFGSREAVAIANEDLADLRGRR